MKRHFTNIMTFGLWSALLAVAAQVAPARSGNYDVSIRGEIGLCAPGLAIDLWSDPGDGSLVRSGSSAQLFVRPSESCFVTVYSIDTVGRIRQLFPESRDDGWVHSGETVRLPSRSRDGLWFEGPAGVEEVFAVGSLDPCRSPAWRGDRWACWRSDRECSPRQCDGRWCRLGRDRCGAVGRGSRIDVLCLDLISCPERRERYASARISFRVDDCSYAFAPTCRGPHQGDSCQSDRPCRPTLRLSIGVGSCERPGNHRNADPKCDERVRERVRAREECDRDRDRDNDNDNHHERGRGDRGHGDRKREGTSKKLREHASR